MILSSRENEIKQVFSLKRVTKEYTARGYRKKVTWKHSSQLINKRYYIPFLDFVSLTF